MSIFIPGESTPTFSLGDTISRGIDALADAYSRREEARAKVEVTKAAVGSPYTDLLIVGVLALIAVAVFKAV